MGIKRKHRIQEVPRNVFEWSDMFNDDLGFAPSSVGDPVDFDPGSPEKVSVLVERVNRGQSLWNVGDKVEHIEPTDDEDFDEYRFAGNQDFGAVVGHDPGGGKHRYVLWTKQAPAKGVKPSGTMLYITESAGFVDSFRLDEELRFISDHSAKHGAEFLVVTSLFTARVAKPFDLRNQDYPITSASMFWARWMVKWVDRVVICWGDTDRLDRPIDFLWMLSRTAYGGRVYSVAESAKYPPKVRANTAGLYLFDYESLIAKRREEDADVEFDASIE